MNSVYPLKRRRIGAHAAGGNLPQPAQQGPPQLTQVGAHAAAGAHPPLGGVRELRDQEQQFKNDGGASLGRVLLKILEKCPILCTYFLLRRRCPFITFDGQNGAELLTGALKAFF